MAAEGVPDHVRDLVRAMVEHLRASEMAIAEALAEAGGPLTMSELAERADYTERTIKKRVETLSEAVHGEPQVRQEGDTVSLHPQLAAAIRDHLESAE